MFTFVLSPGSLKPILTPPLQLSGLPKREQFGTVTLLRWIQEPEGFTRVLANACTDTCPNTQENLPGFVLGKLGTGQGELWEDILGARLPRRNSS